MKALGKGSIASWVRVGLTVAWWLLATILVAWAIAAFAYAVLWALIGIGIVDPSTLPPPRSSADGFQIQISGFEAPGLSPEWTDWQIIAPSLLVGAVTIGGSLIIVGRLLKLFESFTTGEPFRRENALHLRVIWITMVVIELSRYALLVLIGVLLGVFGAPQSVESASFTIDSDNFSSWGSILILIVFAEVFREGARLKEEQELTI